MISYTEYQTIRNNTLALTSRLQAEDMVVQPVPYVSPAKWHLAHTTWFFEAFVLKHHLMGYKEFHPDYNYFFNSYYESVGKRTLRAGRGNMTRPSIADVSAYRGHVDGAMKALFEKGDTNRDVMGMVLLGLQHEQQHQELLVTDTKFILGHNPLFPSFLDGMSPLPSPKKPDVPLNEGIYEIGFEGDGFCFDNELGRHKVYLKGTALSGNLVTNAEYLDFINDKGYSDFRHWLAEGWEWVQANQIKSPLYWHHIDEQWFSYETDGLHPLDLSAPVKHVSYYEADAFAAWRGKRLPTEFEWEAAAGSLGSGSLWEWTGSAYLPYPGYQKAGGAIGEYNGKFMVNQMVLRGGSVATPPGHSRKTYRNFFHPNLQWQFSGIRLTDK